MPLKVLALAEKLTNVDVKIRGLKLINTKVRSY